MSHPLIITCAITGAETSATQQPHLPITAAQQGAAAAAAVEAGASIVHLHVRDSEGKPTQSVDAFRESIAAIRAQAPEAILQISTGGAIGEPIEKRAQPLSLRPEMASLNIGTMNFGDEVFYNHPKDVKLLAAEIYKHGIVPEIEIYEVGMLESALRLLKNGILKNPLHIQFVLGVPGGMSGDLKNLTHLVSMLPPEIHWGVAGVGRFQLPLSTHAILMGGHVRVGFEDNIFYRKNELATSNAQFVARTVRIAQELGREVATPAQTRKLLGMT